MNLSEITELIKVREYLVASSNNYNINRSDANELNGILLLIDKKLVELLKSSSFKEYVGFSNVKEVVQEVRRMNDIKSGLKRV